MQTSIVQQLLETPDGQEADRILRACTHCGFCLATCPTYQLLGDERDSPRGRIYLIKQVLEGAEPGQPTQTHLDRCLTCRNCETTCPSGVEYGRLVDIGRGLVDARQHRPRLERLVRWGLRRIMAYPRRVGLLLTLGRLARPLLPQSQSGKIPPRIRAGNWPAATQAKRSMLVLDGCVQPAAAPVTNAAAARVLDRVGIRLIRARGAGCCGALPQHLSAQQEALTFAKRNIDAWWPHIEAGAEALIITASGCGAQVAEYGHLLRHDPAYAEKARRISQMTCEIGEVLANEELSGFADRGGGRCIAYHPPCTLRNAPGLNDQVAKILTAAGYRLTPVNDVHMCCGSAGTYSILQPQLANRLRDDKLASLQQGQPETIVTANIGCQLHLATA
ncbi:MAG: glycolate oxidase subunit GlcF, partial [Salinisphaera sp.]|nr:glycolate oxidase subunit GlcF [Salinisphaera sp.]